MDDSPPRRELARFLVPGPSRLLFLDNLSPDSSVCGTIFRGKGRILWLGNRAQRTTSAVRDKGCVRHRTPVHRTGLAPPPGLVRRRAYRHRQPGLPVRAPPPGTGGTQPGIGKNWKQVANPPPRRTTPSAPAPSRRCQNQGRPRRLTPPQPQHRPPGRKFSQTTFAPTNNAGGRRPHGVAHRLLRSHPATLSRPRGETRVMPRRNWPCRPIWE